MGKVSKKELNVLIQELSDMVGQIDENGDFIKNTDPIPDASTSLPLPSTSQTQQSKSNSRSTTNGNTKKTSSSCPTTPNRNNNESNVSFQPENISTPYKVQVNSNPIETDQQSFNQQESETILTPSLMNTATETTSVELFTQSSPSTTVKVKEKKKRRVTKTSCINDSYSYAESYGMRDITEKLTDDYDNELVGFTEIQFEIFNQQLQMYVQLSTQYYLQTYSNPTYWTYADIFYNNLLELQEKKSPTLNVLNLDSAIKLCVDWKDSLDTDSSKEIKDYYSKMANTFPPKFMDVIIENPVFMYPTCLPHTSLKPDIDKYKQSRHTYTASEDL